MPNNHPRTLTDARSAILIRGGHLIDPAASRDEVGDLRIENGKIVERFTDGVEPVILDAAGKWVTPGLIDMHTHLREPGYEYQETILSGARAAGAGGFTAVACMPDTSPVIDNAEGVRFVREQARLADARVYPIGAITKGSRGEQLADIADMVESGIVAISDTHTVENPGIMRRALEYASMFNIPVITHCEEARLAGDGVMNESLASTTLGLKGIPNAAEDVIIARDIMLAELTGARLHVAHVSTAGGVGLIREAKRRGLRVTAEVTPYHFSLTDDALRTYDTNLKVKPPLRTARDVEAVQEGLADGTIDAIASDHAPYTLDEKTVEYDAAPFGMIGLETTLGLVITRLVGPGILSLSAAIRTMTAGPARILGLKGGVLTPGAPADITVFDTDTEWTVKASSFFSKSRNSAFDGWTLRGRAVYTIIEGRTCQWHGMQEKKPVDSTS